MRIAFSRLTLGPACDRIIKNRGHELVFYRRLPSEAEIDIAFAPFEVVDGYPCAVRETGFFWNAAHLDTRGLWGKSALTMDGVAERIRDYEAPAQVRDLVARGDLESKYPDHPEQPACESWGGVVVAAQRPRDASITTLRSGRGAVDYWAFVEAACKKYGRDCFIKLHPKNNLKEAREHGAVAQKYGALCGWAGFDIISGCAFVLVYTSGFAVDCWLRGANVAQYARGYLCNTGAVTYTHGEIPDVEDVRDLREQAERALGFLAFKYCYPAQAPGAWLADIVEAYAAAPRHELFPLPEHLSWGLWMGSYEAAHYT